MKKKNRRKIVYLTLIIIFIFLIIKIVTLFSKDIKNETIEKEVIEESKDIGKEISIGIIDFDTFNPILTKNEDVINLSNLIYRYLFKSDEKMKLQMELVDEYNYNVNEMYIKIKKDVLWEDGSDLTTEDIKFTIDKIKGNNTIYTKLLDNITEAVVIDKYNLKLVLNTETKQEQYNLIFPIISKRYFENEEFTSTIKNDIPLSAGAFKYNQKVSDKEYIFKDNIYFSGEKPKINTINIKLYENTGEAFANIKTKKVDIVNTSITNYEEHIGTIGYNSIEYINDNFICLALNTQNQYLTNKDIRHSINIGIDKQEIFNEVYNGKGYISQSIIYPHSYLYKNIDEIYDINNAKQYLANSKIKEKIYLNLIISEKNNKNIEIANKIKESLEKVGIYVEIVQTSQEEYIERLKNRKYDLALVNISISNNIDMSMFIDDKYYGIFNNMSESFNDCIKGINDSASEGELLKKFEELQNIIQTEMPYIGIGFNISTIIETNDIINSINARYNNIYVDINNIYKKL